MLAVSTVVAQMTRYGNYMDRGDNGWPWGLGIAMIVLAVLVVGVIVWAVVYLGRRGSAAPSASVPAPTAAPPMPGVPSAREILDQRYARGEIDTAEYEERRSKLV